MENDSTMIYLTQRSLLRKARYQYIMTASNDERGIDVALLYSPFTFRIMKADTIRIPPLKEMKPTRDILHVMGEQPNPWDLLQPQDVTSRHRGAKPPRRYELLGGRHPEQAGNWGIVIRRTCMETPSL